MHRNVCGDVCTYVTYVHIYCMCVQRRELMNLPPVSDAVSSGFPSTGQVTVPLTPNPMRDTEAASAGNSNFLSSILYTTFIRHSLDSDKHLQTALINRKSARVRRQSQTDTQNDPQDVEMPAISHSISTTEIIIEPAIDLSASTSLDDAQNALPSPPSPPQIEAQSREDKVGAIRRTMQQLTLTMQALQAEIDALG